MLFKNRTAAGRALVPVLAKYKEAKIVVAVPVGPPETIDQLKQEVDEVFCLYTPSSFMAVGQFYDQFPQTSDKEVIELLRGAWTSVRGRGEAGGRCKTRCRLVSTLLSKKVSLSGWFCSSHSRNRCVALHHSYFSFSGSQRASSM